MLQAVAGVQWPGGAHTASFRVYELKRRVRAAHLRLVQPKPIAS